MALNEVRVLDGRPRRAASDRPTTSYGMNRKCLAVAALAARWECKARLKRVRWP